MPAPLTVAMPPSKSSAPSLALIVAGPTGFTEIGHDDRVPSLARIASLGRVSRFACELARSRGALHLWQAALLEALGLSEHADAFPSAAVSHIGEKGQVVSVGECWAHLACVQFAAGMNDVAAAVLADDAALSEQESVEIAATLEPHLRECRYELHPRRTSEWLVRCPRQLDAATVPPEIAFASSLHESLPSGKDAAELRRLMTEMQMLLHEHPVNVQRARNGLPLANATWLWSVASAGRPETNTALPTAFGDVPYLKGLYLLHSQTVQSEAVDVAMLQNAASSSQHSIAVVSPQNLETLEAVWLKPLLGMLKAGAYAKLTLYFERWRFDLQRRDLLRFWRRSAPSTRWPT
jgi:hypothetical protein